MQTKILKHDAVQAVKTLKKTASSKTLSGILDHVRIKIEDPDFLEMSTTNLEQSVKVYIPAFNTSGLIDVIIPFKVLETVISTSKQDHIYFSDGDDGKLKIDKFSARTGDLQDYPQFPEHGTTYPHRIEYKHLMESYGKVKDCIATDETRIILTGVCMDRHNLVATDSYRLGKVPINVSSMADPDFKAIIPKTFFSILETVKHGQTVNIYFTDDEVRTLIIGGLRIELVSKLIHGKYPDPVQLMPNYEEYVYELQTDKMIETLKTGAKIVKDAPVKLTFNCKNVDVCIESKDLGTYDDRLPIYPIKNPDNNIVVHLNGLFLIDILKQFESVMICFQDECPGGVSSKPLLFRTTSDHPEYLLMPIRHH